MIICIQRVSQASVSVDGQITGQIGQGLVVLIGVAVGDTQQDALSMAEKTIGLRVFEDADGKTNLSLADVGGKILCISQFTLLADCRRGRRPSFINAADPQTGNSLYEYYVEQLRVLGAEVQTGVFQTDMKVNLTNNGPFTIVLDSNQLKQPRK